MPRKKKVETPEEEVKTSVDEVVSESVEAEQKIESEVEEVISEAENDIEVTIEEITDEVSDDVADLFETQTKESEKESKTITCLSLAKSLCEAVIDKVGISGFHGGVRPDNITVTDGQVQLGGVLEHTVGQFTPQELEYMAPELFWDGIRCSAGDVYSIGLVLYSLYNGGRLPFWPESGTITPNTRASALQKRMSDEPISMPSDADDQLGSIILRALSFRTENRFSDVDELKTALSLCKHENAPIDLEAALANMKKRSFESQAAASTQSDEEDNPFAKTTIKPERHKNLSYIWILILLVFIIGAFILLLSNCGGNSKSNVPEPTVEPTVEVISTPEPTAEPTASPTPEGPQYQVFVEDVSWEQAVNRCKELGGTLAVPVTRQEYQEITALCNESGATYIWLGGQRMENNVWRNPNGDEITFEYNYWGNNEPSYVDSGDGVAEDYLLLWNVNDVWLLNDSRENPLQDYAGIYSGHIGYVCKMY